MNIKEHQNYKYPNGGHCRWCGVVNETLDHVVNCGSDGCVIQNIEEVMQGKDIYQMKRIAERLYDFLERVEV